jgi:putative transposase
VARIARVIAPGHPHHITQRGNRRQQTFFGDEDYRAYLDLMSEWCCKRNVEVWAYCLMPNHVHIVAVPETEEGLRDAIGEAHRRYTRQINSREGWVGHLWQGRFGSFPMDEGHLLAAVRYIEMNPVRAGLVRDAGAHPWSSASAHMRGEDDKLAVVSPLLAMVHDWEGFLGLATSEEEAEELRRHERTGRPLGDGSFIGRLEGELGRVLRIRGPGRKKREDRK